MCIRRAKIFRNCLAFLFFLFFLVRFVQPSSSEDLCQELQESWQKVDAYQCFCRATTFSDGKEEVTEMRYTFQKPNKIRMDIYRPKNGTVLIYNPEVSAKVRVRPFPKLPFFVLNYNLTDKSVTSDSGSTVDRSDLGHQIKSYCQYLKGAASSLKKLQVSNESNLPKELEVYDDKGQVVEKFEWIELRVNPKLEPKIFTKF